MGLREKADYRTLFYAFVLFPGVPLLQYFVPSLVGWLLPVGLYLGFCSGALTHNQNHCPTFKSKRMNTFYSAWLSVFYGYPTFGWIPTHNQNHHKFVNRAGDASITWRYSKEHNWTVAWTYFFVSSHFQGKCIQDYVAKVRAQKPEQFRAIVWQYITVFGVHAAMLALAVFLHGIGFGLVVYGVAMLTPSLFALWGMFFINYIQHVHCDPWSKYNHSRNFVGRVSNFLVFNNGLHSAHHEQAGLHWSKLRGVHDKLAPHIDPELNQVSIWAFCIKTYVLGLFSEKYRTHQVGRAAWDPPAGEQLDLSIPGVDSSGVGVNASMA